MDLEYRAFAAFHPYLTYSDPENRDFISPSGKAETYTDANTIALFELGKNIFAVLNPRSKEEFDGGLATYYEFIDHFRSAFQKQQENGVLKLVGPTGENITVAWEELDSDQVMAIIWQVRSKNENYKQEIIEDLLIHMFLYHALKLIDSSYIDVRLREGGVDFAISAANAFSNAQALIHGSDSLKIAKSELGYRAALAKIKSDPKQQEKKFIYECWLKWQENPNQYKSTAAFARAMIDKCEHLESTKKVEDWCREWKKGNVT